VQSDPRLPESRRIGMLGRTGERLRTFNGA
jgi:hypothetical protein